MALLNRGRLFDGALLAGALFGGRLANEETEGWPVVLAFGSGGPDIVLMQKAPAHLERDDEEAIIFAIVSAITQGILR